MIPSDVKSIPFLPFLVGITQSNISTPKDMFSNRFAGVPTFMRLPHVSLDAAKIKDVDIGIIGVPWDSGTTNRPGPRHGPRQLRDASTMIRAQHPVSGIRPYEKLNCADLGDVSINPADIEDSMNRITSFYKTVIEKGIKPLTAGGDHLTSLPVLRATADRGPLGMIHFDSHTDLFHSYFDGTISRIAYYGKQLTDSQLNTLTAR